MGRGAPRFVGAGCTSPCSPQTPDVGTIDAAAGRLMAREGVEGMALAVIEDGQVVHVGAYGRRNVERNFR